MIISFPFNISFIGISLDYFFNSKLFLICFLQFFFVKRSNNLFPVKITIAKNICPRHSVFNFFNHTNFFWSIWSVIFCKNIFIFWYYNNITKFKLRIFFINFFTRVNICALFYISRFHFNCAMICIIIIINDII